MRCRQPNDGGPQAELPGNVEKLVKRGDRADIVTAESPEALIEAELADS
jgi:hypothetical protein